MRKIKSLISDILLFVPCTRKIVRDRYISKTKLEKNIWGSGPFIDCFSESIGNFLSIEEQSDHQLLENLKNDMIDCYLRFGATPQEYFLFGFRGMPDKRRKQFLTNQHKDSTLLKKVGMLKYREELRDKYNFYERYREYFKRDVCKIETEDDLKTFRTFCSKHPKFIIKPIDGMCGQGTEIYNVEQSADDEIVRLFQSFLRAETGWIVEELIVQDRRMAEWNPSSVNTVRLPTFLNENGFHVLGPFFRTGRAGSIVDNAASGGVFANIDPRTGVVITDGIDEKGNPFKSHPDSHLCYKGWQIPRWNELLRLAEEAHNLLPSHPYIGWDFALTSEGWVMIEGDWGQFICEFADRKGIKKDFDNLLK